MIQKLLSHKALLLLLGILLLATFFRLYQLGSIPAGLINDEADTGYDAYTILHTGHDQWNAFLPIVSMKGFGDYRPALYTYLVVPSEQLFGLTPFAVRLPSAFFGVLSVLLIYFVGRKLFSKGVGLAAALLFAVSPWAIGMSRVGIESNVAITFTLGGILAFLYSKKSPWLILLGILSFLLAFYTYAAYTLFIPLAFVAVFVFMKKQVPITKKIVFPAVLLFLLFLTPFIISHSAAHTRLSQVGFFNSQDIFGLASVLNDQLGSCHQNAINIVCKLALNKPELLVTTYIKNYLSHFSFAFLYLTGNTTQFSILPERGFEYIFEFLFLLSGIFLILKSKKKEGVFTLSLLLLAVIPDAITGAGHYSRATIMQPFLLLIEGVGFMYLLRIMPKNLIKNAFITLIALFFVYSVSSFWTVYTSYFKINYAMYSQYGYQNLIEKITKEQHTYNNIFLSRHLNDTKQYIYYLFYNAYNPKVFQQKQNIVYATGSDGWVSIDRIENIHFVQTVPTKAEILANKNKVLIISNPIDFPKTVSSIFTVKDLLGNIIFEAVDIKDLQNYYETHPTDQTI